MSDSSNEIKVPFNSSVHLISVCKDTKIKVMDTTYVEYPPGWATVVEDFIKSIQDISTTILEFERSRLNLNIKFETRLKRDQLKVWESYDEYRVKASSKCVNCGSYVEIGRHNPNQELCRHCLSDAGKTGQTGTWLDRYIKQKGES